MDSEYVRDYIGKMCKIDLDNGYYYHGKILSVGEDSLVLLDKTHHKVILALSIIVKIIGDDEE